MQRMPPPTTSAGDVCRAAAMWSSGDRGVTRSRGGRPEGSSLGGARLIAALVAAFVFVYQPAWNGGLLWDDAAHLTRPELRSALGLGRIWFERITQRCYPAHSAFWLQHRLWGDDLTGHLVTLFLHSVAAILLALALLQLAISGAFQAAVARPRL